MKKQLNERALEIRIYLKPNDKADVVFRRNKLLYRIKIFGARRFVESLKKGLADLQRALIFELQGTRRRKWVLEMGLISNATALLKVWAPVTDELRPRFEWSGEAAALQAALGRQ